MNFVEPENLIVIPTYWASHESIKTEERIPYDHPTMVDDSETLTRCIESLRNIKGHDFDVLIVAGATDPQVEEIMKIRVHEIVDNVKGIFPGNIYAWTSSEIHLCKTALAALPVEAKGFLKIDGYANMRNAMILLGSVLGAERLIMIDDDEYVTDPDFLDKIVSWLGKRIGGNVVDALAGFYTKPNGEWEIQERDEAWATYWPKNRMINLTYEKILERNDDEPLLIETPMIFGGCLALTRHLYRQIPFDRRIPRGEDMDYLMNARMYGFNFYMHRKLSIVHDPPPKFEQLWKRLRMDFVRFYSEYQKIAQQTPQANMTKVDTKALEPYPGHFLREDLPERFFNTCVLLAIEFLAKDDKESAIECLNNVSAARQAIRDRRNGFANLLKLQVLWRDLNEAIENSSTCRDKVMEYIYH